MRSKRRNSAGVQTGAVNEVDVSKRPFKIHRGKDTYEAQALIVAAGASARLTGSKGEKELNCHGFPPVATCDVFYRGKPIA